MNFADQLICNCTKKQSYLMAGLDPQPEMIPDFLIHAAKEKYSQNKEFFTEVLVSYCELILQACTEHVAVVKPNIAFFEIFGSAGVQAFEQVCASARKLNLLVIADVKRGDIANTAQAYSRAFYNESSEIFGQTCEGVYVDAITINPFLGLDTTEPFVNDCKKTGKGVFLLCKTSNPGAEELQNFTNIEQLTLSQRIANYAHEAGQELLGKSGYSSLGVVVGATYPEQARELRTLMPKNIFLIPGAGTQGADLKMACAGFDDAKSGAIINMSRALVKDLQSCQNAENFSAAVAERASLYKNEINSALKSS